MAKKVPLRQCVGCGEMKNKRDMMRVLKAADGAICLDVTGKRTAGAHIFVHRENVCRRPAGTKGWSAPLR